MKKVYLAGPITGSTFEGATGWREDVKPRLIENNIFGYSPMRGKAYLSKEDKIKDSYMDFTMSSVTGINVRDYNDCKTSDAILVNLKDAPRVSIGTVMEIAWARAFQVPCVIVLDKGGLHDHGMLTYGNIIVESIDEGVDAIIQILNP